MPSVRIVRREALDRGFGPLTPPAPLPPTPGGKGGDGASGRDGLRLRNVSGFVLCILLLVTLAACSSGSAREAERAQAEDETAESVVAGRQATYIATMVAQGTPTPIPPRAPAVSSLVLTNQINGDGSPVGEYEGFASNAGTIYLCAQLSGRREGRMAAALRDTSDQHNVLAYNDVDVDGGSGTGWVAIPIQLDGSLAPGDYPIWLIFNPGEKDEEWISSVVFTVGSPGSGARQVGNGGNLSPQESGDQSGDPLSPGNQPANNGDDGDDGDDEGGGDSPPIQPRD